MNAALEELLQRTRLSARDVEEFLKRRSFPLVEGAQVTFVYHGRADRVRLRHFIHGLPATAPFERAPGTDLWHLSVEIPEGSRVEYKLEVARGLDRRLIPDPLNSREARDPFGANSVVYASGYQPPDFTVPDPEARLGDLEGFHVASRAFAEARPIAVYLPARFRRQRRYPLLIVHDGEDYLRYAGLRTVLDNLIHRLEIPSMIVAMTQSPNRLEEYADSAAHAEFLTGELLASLEERYPILPVAAARGLMGASFGAVASLAAAWRHPGRFGKLLLQSGSFAFTDICEHDRGPLFDPIVKFVNAFRKSPGRPAERIYLSCGMYESLIYDNRSLVPLLQATGMQVRFREAADGHNWENWRDRLREGLSYLFPGPLWKVYE